METLHNPELCFPLLLNASCRKQTHTFRLVLLSSVLSSISVLNTVLNLLVIISISHFRQLYKPTNLLILSLAISDFLLSVAVLPLEILNQSTCWFLGDFMCFLSHYLMFTVTSATVGVMVMISVDRYVAICDPLHYTTRVTVVRAKVSICLCWFCAGFYSCLCLKDELAQPGRHNSCYGECSYYINPSITPIDLVLTFILPITTIVVLYMRVFVVAVSQARAMRSHITAVTLQSSVTLTTKKSELKAARTLGVLVVVFLMCFCPYYGVSLSGKATFSISNDGFVLCFYGLNSCLNPIIYALFYPWFRKVIRLVVTLKILQPGSREANVL